MRTKRTSPWPVVRLYTLPGPSNGLPYIQIQFYRNLAQDQETLDRLDSRPSLICKGVSSSQKNMPPISQLEFYGSSLDSSTLFIKLVLGCFKHVMAYLVTNKHTVFLIESFTKCPSERVTLQKHTNKSSGVGSCGKRNTLQL